MGFSLPKQDISKGLRLFQKGENPSYNQINKVVCASEYYTVSDKNFSFCCCFNFYNSFTLMAQGILFIVALMWH